MKLNFDIDLLPNFADCNKVPAYYHSAHEYCIKAIAVHEFGHALGIEHENERSDTVNWLPDHHRPCELNTTISGDVFFVTSWNMNSVMNYCGSTWNNGGNLTVSDIVGFQSLYGMVVMGNVGDSCDKASADAGLACKPEGFFGQDNITIREHFKKAARNAFIDWEHLAANRTAEQERKCPWEPTDSNTIDLRFIDRNRWQASYEPCFVATPNTVDFPCKYQKLMGIYNILQHNHCDVKASHSAVQRLCYCNSIGDPSKKPLPAAAVSPASPVTTVNSSQSNRSLKWTTRILHVCFEKHGKRASGQTMQKDLAGGNPNAWETFPIEYIWVLTAVRETWLAHSPMHFICHGLCSYRNGSSYHIRILIHDIDYPRTLVGNRLQNAPGGMRMNFNFTSPSNLSSCLLRNPLPSGYESPHQYCIQTWAVFLFGYALGALQEGSNRHCMRSRTSFSNVPAVWTVPQKDANSIMNFCHPNWTGNGRLSEQDVKSIQGAYGSVVSGSPGDSCEKACADRGLICNKVGFFNCDEEGFNFVSDDFVKAFTAEDPHFFDITPQAVVNCPKDSLGYTGLTDWSAIYHPSFYDDPKTAGCNFKKLVGSQSIPAHNHCPGQNSSMMRLCYCNQSPLNTVHRAQASATKSGQFCLI